MITNYFKRKCADKLSEDNAEKESQAKSSQKRQKSVSNAAPKELERESQNASCCNAVAQSENECSVKEYIHVSLLQSKFSRTKCCILLVFRQVLALSSFNFFAA